MTATFLVTLNVESEAVITTTAEDLDDDLMSSGYDVVEVKPWARPTLDIAMPEVEPPPPTLF